MDPTTEQSKEADETGEWEWSGPIENPSVPEISHDPLCEPHPDEPGPTDPPASQA
jgi:hypothetical protein